MEILSLLKSSCIYRISYALFLLLWVFFVLFLDSAAYNSAAHKTKHYFVVQVQTTYNVKSKAKPYPQHLFISLSTQTKNQLKRGTQTTSKHITYHYDSQVFTRYIMQTLQTCTVKSSAANPFPTVQTSHKVPGNTVPILPYQDIM